MTNTQVPMTQLQNLDISSLHSSKGSKSQEIFFFFFKFGIKILLITKPNLDWPKAIS